MPAVRCVVLALNRVNDDHNSTGHETDERELLCAYIDHLWFDLGGCAGGTPALGAAERLVREGMLMDADEYDACLDGDHYEYHGGFFNVSPIVIEVPYDSDWYLVVDSYHGRIKVKYEEIFE